LCIKKINVPPPLPPLVFEIVGQCGLSSCFAPLLCVFCFCTAQEFFPPVLILGHVFCTYRPILTLLYNYFVCRHFVSEYAFIILYCNFIAACLCQLNEDLSKLSNKILKAQIDSTQSPLKLTKRVQRVLCPPIRPTRSLDQSDSPLYINQTDSFTGRLAERLFQMIVNRVTQFTMVNRFTWIDLFIVAHVYDII